MLESLIAKCSIIYSSINNAIWAEAFGAMITLLRGLTGLINRLIGHKPAGTSDAGSSTTDLGRQAERAVARFLKRRGYRIITCNFRCSVGEIDIIARHDSMLVFVEVKSRSSAQAAAPEENINPAKRRKLLRAARAFLAVRSWQDMPCRFDLATVIGADGKKPHIEHYVDAWQADNS